MVGALGAEVVKYGVPGEFEEFVASLLVPGCPPPILLFPSERAVTVQQLDHEIKDIHPAEAPLRNHARAGVQQRVVKGPFTIIVVDGTWNQARKIAKAVPTHVRHVVVNPGASQTSTQTLCDENL